MYWWLVGRTSLCGELMQKAVQELYAKHKRANAAVYGDLGYLILLNFATAADAVSDFALNLLAQT